MRISHLYESRQANLYHATDLHNAIEIINDNTIGGKTYHYVDDDFVGKKYVKNNRIFGVSLTRSLDFALSWKDIVFVLDQEKLSYNYKFLPIDFWSDPINQTKYKYSTKQKKDEFEEFLIGNILNLNRYIVKIIDVKNTIDGELKYCQEKINALIEYSFDTEDDLKSELDYLNYMIDNLLKLKSYIK